MITWFVQVYVHSQLLFQIHLTTETEQIDILSQRLKKTNILPQRFYKLTSFHRVWTNWHPSTEISILTSFHRDWANWHPSTEFEHLFTEFEQTDILPQRLDKLASFHWANWLLSTEFEQTDILPQRSSKFTSSHIDWAIYFTSSCRDWANWNPLTEFEQVSIPPQILGLPQKFILPQRLSKLTSACKDWAKWHPSTDTEQTAIFPQRLSKTASFRILSKMKSFDRDWTNWSFLAETVKMTS